MQLDGTRVANVNCDRETKQKSQQGQVNKQNALSQQKSKQDTDQSNTDNVLLGLLSGSQSSNEDSDQTNENNNEQSNDAGAEGSQDCSVADIAPSVNLGGLLLAGPTLFLFITPFI